MAEGASSGVEKDVEAKELAIAKYADDTLVRVPNSAAKVPISSLAPGDELLGPDGKPRRVVSVVRGTGPLIKIAIKNRGGQDTSSLPPLLCSKETPLALVCIHRNEGLYSIKNGAASDSKAVLEQGLGITIPSGRLSPPPAQPNAPFENRRTHTIDGDFGEALGHALGWWLIAPRNDRAQKRLSNTINGVNGIKNTKGAFIVDTKGVQNKAFAFGSVYKNKGNYPASYFKTEEEAFEAAIAEARSRQAKGISVFNLLERYQQATSEYKKEYQIMVDESLPGLSIHQSGRGRPKLRAKVQNSAEKGTVPLLPYLRQYEFKGEPGLDADSASGPMPSAAKAEMDDQVIGMGTYHFKSASEYERINNKKLWRVYRAKGFEWPEVSVPVDEMFLGLWLGDGCRRSTAIFNFHEKEVYEFLSSHAAHLDMYLAYHGGLKYSTTQYKLPTARAVQPALRGPEGRDLPREGPRPTYKTLFKRRLERGWVRTENKDKRGRWQWKLPDGTLWSGTVRDELKIQQGTSASTTPLTNAEEVTGQRLNDAKEVDSREEEETKAESLFFDEAIVEEPGEEVALDDVQEAAQAASNDDDSVSYDSGQQHLHDKMKMRLQLNGGAYGDLTALEADQLIESLMVDEPEEPKKNTRALPRTRANRLLSQLKALGLVPAKDKLGPQADCKHIPLSYMFNSRASRLRLLAGLIDSDGYFNYHSNLYIFVQSRKWHERLFCDTEYLCQTLGFTTCTFTAGDRLMLFISGQNIGDIPCLLGRKRAVAPYVRLPGGFHFNVKNVEAAQKWTSITVSDDNKFVRHDMLVMCGSGATSNPVEELMTSLEVLEPPMSSTAAREYLKRVVRDGMPVPAPSLPLPGEAEFMEKINTLMSQVELEDNAWAPTADMVKAELKRMLIEHKNAHHHSANSDEHIEEELE